MMDRPGIDYCRAEAEGGRDFIRRLLEFREVWAAQEGKAPGYYNYRAVIAAAYQFAHWAEAHLPARCGKCLYCRHKDGRCEHGWQGDCPTCKGLEL